MPQLTKDNIISNIYYDLETGYGSAKNTYDQVKTKKPINNVRRCSEMDETTTQQTTERIQRQ